MKHLLLFFLFFSISLQSQDFTKVDDIVSKYPKFSKVEDLATKIETDFTSNKDKIRAAFYWLTQNIRYNLDEYYNPTQRIYNFRYATEEEKQQKLQALKDKIIANAFRTKQGVCEEYAQSFKKICDLLGIEASVIKGNVRNVPEEIGKPESNTNHAWNAVKLNNKWIVLDATWAAGYEYNGKWIREFNNYFYNIPKDKIFKTHYPEDSIWVLRFGRIRKQEFYNQPIYDQNFLGRNTTLLSPENGIIKANRSKEIVLQIKGLKESSLVYYNYNGQRYSKKPIITFNDNIANIKILAPKRSANLIIFIDNKLALQYKVIVR